jgi:two-component system phosphate regulon response regulator PhoB
MTAHILLVEDEIELADALAFALEREGFGVRHAATGKEALTLAATTPRPDLVLLDVMLPDLSGTEVCRKLRALDSTRETPIIMVTARGEEIDRVVGFEVGADDYVVKPYSTRELVLRVRAILRRRQAADAAPTEVRFGVLRIDPEAHQVFVDEQEVVLTALELRLLQTLLARKGRVQSRDTLLSDVWGISADVTTRTVDTHVKRLREKLGAAGSYIETVRGTGYRFRASLERAS